jgi:periplasmic divalent cation tolerance protein
MKLRSRLLKEANMTQFIQIQWTCGNLDEARKVSRYLVQERLVAYAQIIPWVESVFMWNNQQDTAQESKVILTTRLDLYPKIKRVIEENCSYELPEITYTLIDGGNEAYLTWLEENTPDFSKIE